MTEAATATICVCPQCGSSEYLREQAWRSTWQPVTGLRADGNADDYDSFDWGDEVLVVGYSCVNCGWIDYADLSAREQDRLARRVDRVLGRMNSGGK